jgi:hypothetical protein
MERLKKITAEISNYIETFHGLDADKYLNPEDDASAMADNLTM